MSARVLITGGAGFIGHHLAAACLAAGDDVVVFDNLKRGSFDQVPGYATRMEGDVRDRSALDAAMRGVRIVYHLAAQSNVLGAVTDLDYSFTSNVVGTYNTLAAALAAGVERVVFASSREVYGEVDRVPVAESRAFNPKNAYGTSKVSGELYCRAFHETHGLDISILRLANVYGKGDTNRVIPIWLERARNGLPLELYGGEQVIDFVSVSLAVEALRRAAGTALGGQAVNIGGGMGTPLRALSARIRALPGADVDERILPARSMEVTRFVADVTRMETMLGLKPPADPLGELPDLWASLAVSH